MVEYRLSVEDDDIDDLEEGSQINVDDDLGDYGMDDDEEELTVTAVVVPAAVTAFIPPPPEPEAAMPAEPERKPVKKASAPAKKPAPKKAAPKKAAPKKAAKAAPKKAAAKR